MSKHNLALAAGSRSVAERQARGRGPTPGIASSAWDVFPRSGSAAELFPWQPVSRLLLSLLSPPRAPSASKRCRCVQSLGDSFPLPRRPPSRTACPGRRRWALADAGGVVPTVPLCARRGGAQRRPVPERSRGADQLPVHGAHVPLRGGPGACAEGHGRSWSQQVGSFCCFKLLTWSGLPSGQCSAPGPVWRTG